MADGVPPKPPRDPGPLVCLGLLAATLIAYGPVWGNDFVNYDDPIYVTGNEHVQAGLTWESLRWDLTSTAAFNWHPLTWMSLQLDHELFGPRPWGYHLTNLLLHAGSAVLLFLVLRGMTGAVWRSALVAALFALHPLHVESVAWVAERKDVLSALFGMLALLAYLGYVRRPGVGRYLGLLLALALGLMAKPMLVTWPVVLLLLDSWPLRRGQPGRLLLEKVPLAALAAASVVITLLAQHHGGAVRDLHEIPLGARAANAVVSYAAYLGKALWPFGLVPFYPYRPPPAWQVVAAGALLAGLSALAVATRRRRPYLLVGWLWFQVTLLPVIGLVQVGEQALADRYTYLPLVGPFVALAWGLAELTGRPALRAARVPAAAAVLLACAAGTWLQAGRWHDSRTLWEHALRVTADNPTAENNLGAALLEQGDLPGAEGHLRAAVRLVPDFVVAHNNLGIVLDQRGRLDEAVACYRRSLELDPEQARPRTNLGIDLGKQGKMDEAVTQLAEAVRLDPDFAEGHFQLAFALARQRRLGEAIEQAWRSYRLEPGNAQYRVTLAHLLQEHGDAEKAAELLRTGRR